MNKNFNEMSFDELKCYRREGLWRSLGLLLVIIFVITGMVLMEVNHVSPSNQNRFSSYWFDHGHCALWLPDASDGSKSCHARPSGLGQEIRDSSKHSLPMAWHVKGFASLGESIGDWVGFASSFKPQVQQTNVQDQIDIIQMDNELEREQKVDQVLDTITPEDKKSE